MAGTQAKEEWVSSGTRETWSEHFTKALWLPLIYVYRHRKKEKRPWLLRPVCFFRVRTESLPESPTESDHLFLARRPSEARREDRHIQISPPSPRAWPSSAKAVARRVDGGRRLPGRPGFHAQAIEGGERGKFRVSGKTSAVTRSRGMTDLGPQHRTSLACPYIGLTSCGEARCDVWEAAWETFRKRAAVVQVPGRSVVSKKDYATMCGVLGMRCRYVGELHASSASPKFTSCARAARSHSAHLLRGAERWEHHVAELSCIERTSSWHLEAKNCGHVRLGGLVAWRPGGVRLEAFPHVRPEGEARRPGCRGWHEGWRRQPYDDDASLDYEGRVHFARCSSSGRLADVPHFRSRSRDNMFEPAAVEGETGRAVWTDNAREDTASPLSEAEASPVLCVQGICPHPIPKKPVCI